MAKYYGSVGYGETKQTAPGIWEDVITERPYYGDILQNIRRLDPGEELNNNLSIMNRISIVSDAYALEHFFAIRYVNWAGSLWEVNRVEVQAPRLILSLGAVYDGKTTGTSSAA